MDMIKHLLSDATFWVMLSTVLCFGFIGSKAWRPLLAALDARAVAIRNRLAEADALHREAQAILEEYKEKSANALHEAEEILKTAETRIAHLQAQMEDELKETIARQEANARMRIARLENESIDAVKTAIIQASINQARDKVTNENKNATDLSASLTAIGQALK